MTVITAPHPTIFRRRVRRRSLQQVRSLYVLLFQMPFLPAWLQTVRDAERTMQMLRLTARNRSAFSRAILDADRGLRALLAP